MTIAGGTISGGTLTGDVAVLYVTELPVQFDILPPGSPLPIGGEEWTPGDVVPLKRVVKRTDGQAAANVALVIASGESFEVKHPDADVAGAIRKEVSLDFGDASRTTARVWARRWLNIAADSRRGITIELIPNVGPVPYLDFGIGDNISVLGEQHRVVAISMKLGPDSVIYWSVDLDQPRMLLEERLDAIMRRFMPGGAAGRTILPSPTEPSFPSNQTGVEKENTWTWHGPLGEIQVYKNHTAITGATVDAADLGAGETKATTITDAARKYVQKVDNITISAGGERESPLWTPPDGRWLQEVSATADDDPDSDAITITVRYV